MTASPRADWTRRHWTGSGRCWADEHPHTLLSAASLALDLRAAGAFRESVDLLRETWEKYREVLGDDMTDTLRTAASLAVSLRKAGEQTEALTWPRTPTSGTSGATVATIRTPSCAHSTWPGTTRQQGTCRGRWIWRRRLRRRYRASLGDDHPNTLVAANNLACYLRRTGRLPEALALMDGTRWTGCGASSATAIR